MSEAAKAASPTRSVLMRSQVGLLRAMAFATGVGAGGMLFAATLHAVRLGGAIGPGYLAGAQALGVVLGAAGVLSLSWMRTSRAGAAVAAAFASVACVLVAGSLGLNALAALFGMFIVGTGVGVAVARIDGAIAETAQPDRPASSVLTAAFFGALGAMAAPLLVQGERIAGLGGYLAPALAFGVVGLLWAWLRPTPPAEASRDKPSWRLWTGRQPWLLLFLAFLFGVVDNGVLALAPAEYFARGASEWVSAFIGVAAAGGLAIAQILSVRSLESRQGGSANLGLSLSLVGLALSLAALGIGPGPLAGAALVLLTGGYAEFVFGFGLFLYLARAPGSLAGATAAFVAACGLGEFVGPLALQALADAGVPGAGYWLASAAAGLAALACVPTTRPAELQNV